MEETKSRPGNPGDRAQIAAEKLRALRERANSALDEHRQRLSQIETELSSRVRQLAEEFETTSARSQSHTGRDDEVAALREQLAEDRAKHDKFVEQLAAARRQLDAIQAQPCAACQDAAQQLADAHGELNRLREQLQAAHEQQEEDRARHDKFTEQVAAARQAINDLQSKSHEQSAQLQVELEAARGEKSAAQEQATALARDLELLHAECDALQQRTEQLEQQRTASLDEQRQAADLEAKQLREHIATLEAKLGSSQNARHDVESRAKSLEAELAAARQGQEARAGEVAAVRQQHADLETRLADLSTRNAAEQQAQAERLTAAEAKRAELVQQLATAETEKSALAATLAEGEAERRKLIDAIAAAQEQIDNLQRAGADATALNASLDKAKAEAAAHQRAHEELKASLEQGQSELARLRDQSCPRAELDDLQHKFELALADVQKLKRENGDLREQLATRPEASDHESPELVALRTECEQLTLHVEELERAAATTADAGPSQEFQDLHRRFEMAVDDVRQLKQENAQLRDQLAAARPSGGAPAAGGSNDWAAQKARLLAMLEQEEGDGPIDPKRRKERASIEETIQRTDLAIAEKEREVARLRAAQEAQAAGPACSLDQEREQILSADELVATERERLAKLQSEWEGKLRAAELEFSVERAKLAREQAAVKERLFDLQKLEAQGAGAAAEAGDPKPRRRWLAALGIGEEGDEPQPK